MGRQLFVCNSVYQIFVALWIKYDLCSDEVSDIIISDHMNDGSTLADRLRETALFGHVYYVESLAFARYRVKQNRLDRIGMSLRPGRALAGYVRLQERYTQLYTANVDAFAQLLFDALAHKNPDIGLFLYEDGMFTYSRLFEKDYLSTRIPVSGRFKKFLHRAIYRKKTIYSNVDKLLVFHPENMLWKADDMEISALEKVRYRDPDFLNLCNRVFAYSDSEDLYDKKYIFLEESFFAEGTPINDLEVLNQIADRIGKENIMVKIHPRNPVNRFAEQGYQTNRNTSVPWEVILMNVDMSDKVLITVSSSSILNPILIFGMEIHAFSIYECVDHAHCRSRLLSGEMWEIAKMLFMKYSSLITICRSIDEIR